MNKQALQIAIDNLSILMVYLYSSEVKTQNGFDPLIPNQELIAQYNILTKSCYAKEFQDETAIKRTTLVYQTEARMRYIKGPISEEIKQSADNDKFLDERVVAEITAVFVSEYLINGEDELPQDAVLEFGRLNVPHQIWPYWREYCQSTCARMALPVSILPMFVINKSIDAER
jgi:hypothetical protein